jgi:glutaredoxin-like protein NrdH
MKQRGGQMDNFEHVPGENRGTVKLYALSTCIWCRKTENLLSSLGVAYDYCDVDQLFGDAQTETEAEIMKWNPKVSFPTMVINEEKCILGFDETTIRRELGNG